MKHTFQSRIKAPLKSAAIGSMAALSIFSMFPMKTVQADARLNAATAAGTRVNSDPDSLLRFGLPFKNKEARDLQDSIELIKANLRVRRPQFAKLDSENVVKKLKANGEKMVKAMPENHRSKGLDSLTKMGELVEPIKNAIDAEISAGAGSVQEKDYLAAANRAQSALADELSTFEALFVPDDFKRKIPEEYADLPALQGRATVEMTLVKPDGSKYDVDGKLYDKVLYLNILPSPQHMQPSNPSTIGCA
jgi:hypothetical protein